MFCAQCGVFASDETTFCSHGGQALQRAETSQDARRGEPFTGRPVSRPSDDGAPGAFQQFQPTQQASEAVSKEEAIRIFVGKNFDYFKLKWKVAEQKKNNQSWNWAAFFMMLSWLAYRKMYLYSWIFIGAVGVEELCDFVFSVPDHLSHTITVAIATAFGCQGNHCYKLHVEKKVTEIINRYPPEQARIELQKQGGTSVGAAIGFLSIFLALVVLIVAAVQK